MVRTFGKILRVPEVLQISCDTGTLALPDMSALTLYALECCVYLSGNALVFVLQL